MVTKTIRISDECDQILKALVKSSNSKSESSFIEKMIMSIGEDSEKGDSKQDEIISLMYNEILQLKAIAKSTDKKAYLHTDLLNSFITNGISVSDEDFISAEKYPHSWITQSEQNLKNKIYAQQTQKLNETGYKKFHGTSED